MKTIVLKLYSFNELDKDAKGKALTTYRDLNVDFNWWEDEFEDFVQMCASIGIAVKKDSIVFRGFYSQGDGSGFSAKVDIALLQESVRRQAWKSYAPGQEFPFIPASIDHRVWGLVAKNILPNDPQIFCRQNQYGVVVDLGSYVINEHGKIRDNISEELDLLEEWLRGIAETLNRYLYNRLEEQYEYLTGDEAIEESILSNDYLFTADGRSANHLKILTQRNILN